MNEKDINISKIIEEIVVKTVKEALENLMNAERQAFIEEHNGTKNGYYYRDLMTKFGYINDLKVPRDREGEFKTQILEPYKRTFDIDDLIIALYAKGTSTRKIADILEELFNHKYSQSTISRITDITKEEIDKWQRRELKKRYFAIYIDALFINLRIDTVEKEAVHIVLGVDEEGRQEILGFYINPSESATSWEFILKDLYDRGIREVLLFIADGLSGLSERIKKYYSLADFQSCTVHAMRNVITRVRASDKEEVGKDLRNIFNAMDRKQAEYMLDEFTVKWKDKYPGAVTNLNRNRDYLFNYYNYPESIRKSIRSTNIIERMNKEFRRRIKIIDSLPTEESARKIIYLRVIELNNKMRAMHGFRECKDEIEDLFRSRYP